jgi:phospholipase/lecithinase/hemolysin
MSKRKAMSPPAVSALLILGGFFQAQAGTIDAIYAFGDSLTDVGNIYTATGGSAPAAPYVNGQFTNGNVWVQDLASDLGLAPLEPSLLGGKDFAYGTAESGVTAFNTSAANTDLVGATGQLAQFQATTATADPNALYTIWIGSNDLSDILTGQSPSQYGGDIGAVVGNTYSAITTLAGMGAKNFLILTVTDLGKTPEVMADGPAASAGASFLSSSFDTALTSGIPGLAAADSVNISVLDTYALLDSIVADSASYGFSNVTQPCLTGEVDYAGGTPCANPGQYLFWDELHPTAAGHEIVADEALALVTPEPASISLIAVGLIGLVIRRRPPQPRTLGLSFSDRRD